MNYIYTLESLVLPSKFYIFLFICLFSHLDEIIAGKTKYGVNFYSSKYPYNMPVLCWNYGYPIITGVMFSLIVVI